MTTEESDLGSTLAFCHVLSAPGGFGVIGMRFPLAFFALLLLQPSR